MLNISGKSPGQVCRIGILAEVSAFKSNFVPHTPTTSSHTCVVLFELLFAGHFLPVLLHLKKVSTHTASHLHWWWQQRLSQCWKLFCSFFFGVCFFFVFFFRVQRFFSCRMKMIILNLCRISFYNMLLCRRTSGSAPRARAKNSS